MKPEENSKATGRFTAGLLGAVLALQTVFVGMLVSHLQDRSIHPDQQYVTLAAYQADREHFGRSLEEIKLALREIQQRLNSQHSSYQTPPPDSVGTYSVRRLPGFPPARE